MDVADQLSQARVKFLNLVLLDANKEFDAAVQAGFGHDGAGSDTAADFAPVRGDYASNKFVQQLQGEIASLPKGRLPHFHKSPIRQIRGIEGTWHLLLRYDVPLGNRGLLPWNGSIDARTLSSSSRVP